MSQYQPAIETIILKLKFLKMETRTMRLGMKKDEYIIFFINIQKFNNRAIN